MCKDKKLKRIYVFISSPGDVAKARENVRYAVNRINDLMAKDYGFIFEPIGWEDIPPGKQERAQEQINKYVDKADIFIGVFNQRFGTSTGIADSGTQEEYDRIEDKWKKSPDTDTSREAHRQNPHDQYMNLTEMFQ